MAQGWKQILEAGMQVREMSRSQAQRIVDQLVKEGQLAESRAKAYVEELVDRSRRRTDEISKLVQREIRSQLSALGLATRDDIARLEEKIERATQASGRSGPASKSRSTTPAKSKAKSKTGSKSTKSGSKSTKSGSKSTKSSRSGSS